MPPGMIPGFEIGAEEHLGSGRDEFPIAVNQWQMVSNFLREARGAVIARPERVRLLWLMLRNETEQTKKRGTYRFLHGLHGLRANKALCPPLPPPPFASARCMNWCFAKSD